MNKNKYIQKVALLVLVTGLAHAQVDPEAGAPDQAGNPHIPETALIEKLPRKEQLGHFLRFQAVEKKVFLEDISAERRRQKDEWDKKAEELLSEQREERSGFEPENHTVDERRDFYVNQRKEMADFKAQRAAAFKELNDAHSRRRAEFKKRQADDRTAAKEKYKN